MNKKTIHWLIPYDNPSLDTVINSNLASIRLRLGSLIRQKKLDVTFGNNIQNNPSALVIGKIGTSSNNMRENLWVNQIEGQKRMGT